MISWFVVCLCHYAVDLKLIGAVPKTCYLPMAPNCTVYPLDPFDLPSSADAFGSKTAVVVGLLFPPPPAPPPPPLPLTVCQ